MSINAKLFIQQGNYHNIDNWVLSTGLIMLISHRKEIRKPYDSRALKKNLGQLQTKIYYYIEPFFKTITISWSHFTEHMLTMSLVFVYSFQAFCGAWSVLVM